MGPPAPHALRRPKTDTGAVCELGGEVWGIAPALQEPLQRPGPGLEGTSAQALQKLRERQTGVLVRRGVALGLPQGLEQPRPRDNAGHNLEVQGELL